MNYGSRGERTILLINTNEQWLRMTRVLCDTLKLLNESVDLSHIFISIRSSLGQHGLAHTPVMFRLKMMIFLGMSH